MLYLLMLFYYKIALCAYSLPNTSLFGNYGQEEFNDNEKIQEYKEIYSLTNIMLYFGKITETKDILTLLTDIKNKITKLNIENENTVEIKGKYITIDFTKNTSEMVKDGVNFLLEYFPHALIKTTRIFKRKKQTLGKFLRENMENKQFDKEELEDADILKKCMKHETLIAENPLTSLFELFLGYIKIIDFVNKEGRIAYKNNLNSNLMYQYSEQFRDLNYQLFNLGEDAKIIKNLESQNEDIKRHYPFVILYRALLDVYMDLNEEESLRGREYAFKIFELDQCDTPIKLYFYFLEQIIFEIPFNKESKFYKNNNREQNLIDTYKFLLNNKLHSYLILQRKLKDLS